MQPSRGIPSICLVHRRRTSRSAFSLIELILVITIISIMAAIAVPRYSSAQSRYRADAAARRVIADLEFAREHARTTSTSITVQIRPSNDIVVLRNIQDPDDPSNAHTRTFLAYAPYHADIVTADFGGDSFIIFDGFGMPDSGGSLVLTSGSESCTVVLDADTGEAVIQ